MRPVLHRLHEVEEKYDSDCSWNSTDSFAHHLLYSCMGGNLYSYYKCKEISFVPVWGVLCVLILHFQIWIQSDQRKEVGVEKMKVNEEIYKNIFQSGTEQEGNIVPLEEALIVNEPELRRELIMNVLNDNPEEYVELLKQARMNEDVEVVHYAITAMVELSKEYDSKLQELERLHQISPEDPEVMEQYCEFMEEYLSQGLLEEQIERVQRQRYEQLLEKKLKHQEDLHTCVCMVKNLMKLGDFEKAHEILQIIEKKWHRHEAYWILKVQYCVEQKQGEELKRTLDKMKKEHIYLSSKGREDLALWIDS